MGERASIFANLEVLGLLSDVVDPLLCLPDQNGGRECHAPLASRPEGCADQLVDGVLPVGVGHDDTVVLGSHVALDLLAVLRPTLVNVLAGNVAT